MTRRRRASAWFLLVAALPTTARGEAQLRLEWRAPDSCPSRERLLARTQELLGHAPEAGLKGELQLDARATELSRDSWQLDLSSRSDGGIPTSRSVKATSCAELADAAALLIALAIDPELQVAAAGSSATFEPDSPAPATPNGAAPAPATDAPAALPAISSAAPRAVSGAGGSAEPERSGPPFLPRVSVSAAAWSRRLAGTSAGVLAQGGVSRAHGWLLATLGYFPSRHTSVAGATAGGDLSLLSGGLEVGYGVDLNPSSLEVSPLVAAELEWVRGSGSGVEHPADAELLLLGLGAGGRASLRVTRSWLVVAQVVFSVLPRRPRFVLQGVGEVYRPEPWGLRLSFGVEWRGR